ncbi:hypothetical protein Pmani_029296 [Petrolisthes manimaculis]|uniref:Uncharacterized protein n=1 Tax=Petrolisthes manimaculis TaxID=1843537 RepID=A0AAE1TX49_9EUCA|nr:hypothetical protein Pmani_029296 [Petrolisthes manimaculis]
MASVDMKCEPRVRVSVRVGAPVPGGRGSPGLCAARVTPQPPSTGVPQALQGHSRAGARLHPPGARLGSSVGEPGGAVIDPPCWPAGRLCALPPSRLLYDVTFTTLSLSQHIHITHLH